ncbi:MAG: hypothetical protein JW881_15980 [Spirochaetales bacterium]|nr:hypothetical protein [Spirochaetales bacterium]
MKALLVMSILVLFSFSAGAQTILNNTDSWYMFSLEYELGFIKLFHHTLQIGEGTTEFDYISRGGQEILFPFQRFTASVTLFDHHTFRFLYQPFRIETKTRVYEDITIDDVTFPAGTNLDLVYGFPFYRVSYIYDFRITDSFSLGAGLALQMRNASIIFEDRDGTGLSVSQNLGPVPAVVLTGTYIFPGGFYLAADVTGLYASSAIINGADFEFEGSILDASLRAGFPLAAGIESFLNLRFFGGSAKGTSENDDRLWSESVGDYTANYIATVTITMGFVLK